MKKVFIISLGIAVILCSSFIYRIATESSGCTAEEESLIKTTIEHNGHPCNTVTYCLIPKNKEKPTAIMCDDYKHSYDLKENGGNWIILKMFISGK